MLADSYMPLYVFFGPFAAFLSLVVALLVEVPILWLLWRRTLWSTLRWVLIANAISAALGVWPIVRSHAAFGIDINSDPWETYQAYWHSQITLTVLLFAITIGGEFLVYLLMKVTSKSPIRIRRLLAGTMLSNAASYGLLVAYFVSHLHPPLSGDFAFVPDTKWAKSNHRAWFIDPATSYLCSIRLDGSDRRTEVPHPLSHAGEIWGVPFGTYALLPAQQTILFTDPQFNWWSQHNGVVQQLSLQLSDDARYPYFRESVWQEVQRAVLQLGDGNTATQPSEIFFYGKEKCDWQVDVPGSAYQFDCCMLPSGESPNIPLVIKERETGRTLTFCVSNGLIDLGCIEPAPLDDEKLIVFRCGGWLMVMDLQARKVGRLVQGHSMVLQTPQFGPPQPDSATQP